MKIKHVITLLFVIALACISAFAQAPQPDPATPALPTFVGAGAAFNQIGDPRTNLWATAIYPVASSAGVYASTTTDVIPRLTVDPATKRSYYAFTTSIRQGIHKTLYHAGAWTLLLGGDAGVGLNQAAPSGVNVSFAGSFTTTAVYQFKPHWALAVPVRGLWVNSSWNLVPQIGVLFKP